LPRIDVVVEEVLSHICHTAIILRFLLIGLFNVNSATLLLEWSGANEQQFVAPTKCMWAVACVQPKSNSGGGRSV